MSVRVADRKATAEGIAVIIRQTVARRLNGVRCHRAPPIARPLRSPVLVALAEAGVKRSDRLPVAVLNLLPPFANSRPRERRDLETHRSIPPENRLQSPP